MYRKERDWFSSQIVYGGTTKPATIEAAKIFRASICKRKTRVGSAKGRRSVTASGREQDGACFYGAKTGGGDCCDAKTGSALAVRDSETWKSSP